MRLRIGPYCRSCTAPVFWTITINDKRMLVNAEPSPEGNLRLTSTGSNTPPLAEVLSKQARATREYADDLYVPHFATCPKAAGHRRAKT